MGHGMNYPWSDVCEVGAQREERVRQKATLSFIPTCVTANLLGTENEEKILKASRKNKTTQDTFQTGKTVKPLTSH